VLVLVVIEVVLVALVEDVVDVLVGSVEPVVEVGCGLRSIGA
jgi:hypothetical protein